MLWINSVAQLPPLWSDPDTAEQIVAISRYGQRDYQARNELLMAFGKGIQPPGKAIPYVIDKHRGNPNAEGDQAGIAAMLADGFYSLIASDAVADLIAGRYIGRVRAHCMTAEDAGEERFIVLRDCVLHTYQTDVSLDNIFDRQVAVARVIVPLVSHRMTREERQQVKCHSNDYLWGAPYFTRIFQGVMLGHARLLARLRKQSGVGGNGDFPKLNRVARKLYTRLQAEALQTK